MQFSNGDIDTSHANRNKANRRCASHLVLSEKVRPGGAPGYGNLLSRHDVISDEGAYHVLEIIIGIQT